MSKLSALLAAVAIATTQANCARAAEPGFAIKAQAGMKKVFEGLASFYADKFHGRKTASGQTFNMNALTCAHKSLPFGTKLMVRNTNNGKTCVVTVNDRGPYCKNRVVDLSRAAANLLGITGVARVVAYSPDVPIMADRYHR